MSKHLLLLAILASVCCHLSAASLPAPGRTLSVVSALAQWTIPEHESAAQFVLQDQRSALLPDLVESGHPLGGTKPTETERPIASPRGDRAERGFSLGLRGGVSLPENDLQLTTGRFPSFTIGAYGQYLIHRSHQLRPVGEWWYFSAGRQDIQTSSQSQTIKTKVRALLMGGEYLYRFGGVAQRLSAGGGFYLVRWSVASVNSLDFPAGANAEGSGTSHWTRSGEGLVVSYGISRHLEVQGRWIRSNYGYEHIPVNVVTVGAGWRF